MQAFISKARESNYKVSSDLNASDPINLSNALLTTLTILVVVKIFLQSLSSEIVQSVKLFNLLLFHRMICRVG